MLASPWTIANGELLNNSAWNDAATMIATEIAAGTHSDQRCMRRRTTAATKSEVTNQNAEYGCTANRPPSRGRRTLNWPPVRTAYPVVTAMMKMSQETYGISSVSTRVRNSTPIGRVRFQR